MARRIEVMGRAGHLRILERAGRRIRDVVGQCGKHRGLGALYTFHWANARLLERYRLPLDGGGRYAGTYVQSGSLRSCAAS